MATHYARQIGIPACGYGVSETQRNRTSRWKAAPVSQTKKEVTEQVTTSRSRYQVDCVPCQALMDEDGIP